MTPRAHPKGRATLSSARRVEARDVQTIQRSLAPTIATITLSLTLFLLTACATDTKKPTASPTPQRRFNVVVATNDAPLPPPWQTPTPYQQQQNNAFQSSNQPTPTLTPILTQTSTPAPTPPPRVRILPLTARIASVNEKLRYVIVDFTNSRQPVPEEKLGVYRVGEKVAEIKISGPYRNTTVAADIVAGEVKYGDEVKTE